MKQPTKRLLSMALALFFIVGALVVYYYQIIPIFEETNRVRAEVKSHEDFIRTQEGAIKQVEKLIGEYSGEDALQEVISQALPRGPDLSGAMVQISGIARIHSMELSDVTFGVGGNRAAVQRGRSATSTTSIVKPLGSLSVEVNLKGDYENFKDMLRTLENNLRIFEVQNFNIIPSQDKGGVLRYQFNVKFVTYYQTK